MMRCLVKGHVYELDTRHVTFPPNVRGRWEVPQVIEFVNKEAGRESNGTTTQEVLRALIDRTRHCNNCLPHWVNKLIVYHLRMALVLHEMRALERKVEKGELKPEHVMFGGDGHFHTRYDNESMLNNLTMDLVEAEDPWVKHPNHQTDISPHSGEKASSPRRSD